MITRPLYRYNEITGSNKTVNKELGISVQFLQNGVFKPTYTTTEITKNQLINYILTNPGERFFNPSFGSGIRQLLFENVTDLDSLEAQISQGISQNVQNIRVKSVDAIQENNSIFITIDYSINNINDQLTVELTANE
jgi:phage baseplate assembly protein W